MLISDLTIKAGGHSNGINAVVVLYMFQVSVYTRKPTLPKNAIFAHCNSAGILHLGLDVQYVGLSKRDSPNSSSSDWVCAVGCVAVADT